MGGNQIDYHPKVSDLLAHAYFALTEAYKEEFLYQDKGTDPTKQAAITCATVAAIKPLHAPQSDVDQLEYVYMNQMLAVRCGCAVLSHPFHTHAWSERWRFYKALERIEFPSLRPMIDEAVANNGDLKSDFQIKLSKDEECKLQLMVILFIALSRQDPKDRSINPNPDIRPASD